MKKEHEKKLKEAIENMEYTKGLDDGMYNDGYIDGFSDGFEFAYKLIIEENEKTN